ncbi:MAG: TIGR02587 family membrane protein [Novosphingobium sp.]|nr:TIGR02587 family membrane protein [Novosphingobium sp.]
MPDRAASSASGVATTNAAYAVALARAFAGALIFGLPLLLTMEMWWLGFEADSRRLTLFLVVDLVVLYGLSHVAGFEESHSWVDDVLDAFAAFLAAAIVAALVLAVIGAIEPGQPLREIAGKIAVQAVPLSFGAMIGAKLLGEGERIEEQEHWRRSFSGSLFLMLAGALFLSFTVAPTEEIYLIAYMMTGWQTLALIGLSVVLLHAIVYNVGLPHQDARTASTRTALLRSTLPGYAIAVLASAFILWVFGRLGGVAEAASMIAVLALPGAVGAAIARVVI